ncbi:MAG: hypothetical protein MMC33_004733 [Icmadophila ericetorum]|nr:hypothetical protein [Icmadophila ericetorum]
MPSSLSTSSYSSPSNTSSSCPTPSYFRNLGSYRRAKLPKKKIRSSSSIPTPRIKTSQLEISAQNACSLSTPPNSLQNFLQGSSSSNFPSSSKTTRLQAVPPTPPSSQPNTPKTSTEKPHLHIQQARMPSARFSCGHISLILPPTLNPSSMYSITCRHCCLSTLNARMAAFNPPIQDLISSVEAKSRRLWFQWDPYLGAERERTKWDLREMVRRRDEAVRAFERAWGKLRDGEVPAQSRDDRWRLERAMVRIDPA